MLLKNLINSPAIGVKKIQIKGLAINSKEVKKDFIFFAIKGQKVMEKNLLMRQLREAHL
jgi:UDP-N-acetylmuramyl tripeptide synthase